MTDGPQSNRSQNVFQIEEISDNEAKNPPEVPADSTKSSDLPPSFIPPEESSLDEYVEEPKRGIGRFFIPIFLIFLIIVGAVIFTRLFSGKKSGSITLTYWGLWEDESIIQPLIDAYKTKHPNVIIKYVMQTPKQYRERLTAAIQRAEVDIFRFHNTWVPMLKTDLALLPDDVLSKKQYENTFYPVTKDDLLIGNNYVGIPLMFEGLALFYNSDLINAAGVGIPKTWDDLQQVVQTLTVKDLNGEIKTAGIALGTANNIAHFSDILALMLLQNNANLKTLSGPEASEALAYYRLFAEKPNNVWDQAQEDSITAFAKGKVAFIFAPSWEAFSLYAKNPQLKFKTAPVPQLPGTNITWASYWVEGVSKKSPHQKEAWEFVKFLSEKENIVKLYTEETKVRQFGEAYSRSDLAETLKDHPVNGAFVLQAPQAKSFPLASSTHDNGLNDRLIKYLEDAVNSLEKGASPEGALQTAASGFNQVLTQYGLISAPVPTTK